MSERVLISIEDALVTFGGKPLFEEMNFHINEGDKICLVGRNGAGKSTLMKLISGDLDMDSGKRFCYPGTRIGYLEQSVEFDRNQTVREFVVSALTAEDKEERQYLADIVMVPLELIPDAKMGELSGGQLRRAALAKALVYAPDILLLDEPTNHLDLSAIEWLEQYLAAYKGALVCISHDRTFLSAISRKVFWIDRGRIRVSPGGYAEFEDWQEKMLEQEMREIKNLQKKIEAEVDWTQGGVTGRRKRNIRRINELARLRDKIRADKAAYLKATAKIEMEAENANLGSKRVVEFKNICKKFTRNDKETIILDNFNFTILRGDRIGILGRNGSGKSTFLKLLVNELEQDSGFIKRAKNIEISYFDQNRSDLIPENTIQKTLCPDGGDYISIGSGPDKKQNHVCGYLKKFLFDPKLARERVSTLSGGQQNRLMLAKILANPGNVLILDEPTNDLDMDTLDMLQGMIADYQGTLIIVSHDRDFLDRTVTEVLAFNGNGHVESHMGGYTDYLQKKKGVEHKPSEVKSIKTETAAKPQAAKLSYKYKFELENLPGKIAELEAELKDLGEKLADSALYMQSPEVFDEASKRYGVAKKELEKAETRWLELEDMRAAAGE